MFYLIWCYLILYQYQIFSIHFLHKHWIYEQAVGTKPLLSENASLLLITFYQSVIASTFELFAEFYLNSTDGYCNYLSKPELCWNPGQWSIEFIAFTAPFLCDMDCAMYRSACLFTRMVDVPGGHPIESKSQQNAICAHHVQTRCTTRATVCLHISTWVLTKILKHVQSTLFALAAVR